jgi:hypothetical protein
MHEFGKIYAVLTAFENLIPIGVSQAYAEIWKVKKLGPKNYVFINQNASSYRISNIST